MYNKWIVSFFFNGMGDVMSFLANAAVNVFNDTDYTPVTAGNITHVFSFIDTYVKSLFSHERTVKIWGLFFAVWYGFLAIPVLYYLILNFIFKLINATFPFIIQFLQVVLALIIGPVIIFLYLFKFKITEGYFKKWIAFIGNRFMNMTFLFVFINMFAAIIRQRIDELTGICACKEYIWDYWLGVDSESGGPIKWLSKILSFGAKVWISKWGDSKDDIPSIIDFSIGVLGIYIVVVVFEKIMEKLPEIVDNLIDIGGEAGGGLYLGSSNQGGSDGGAGMFGLNSSTGGVFGLLNRIEMKKWNGSKLESKKLGDVVRTNFTANALREKINDKGGKLLFSVLGTGTGEKLSTQIRTKATNFIHNKIGVPTFGDVKAFVGAGKHDGVGREAFVAALGKGKSIEDAKAEAIKAFSESYAGAHKSASDMMKDDKKDSFIRSLDERIRIVAKHDFKDVANVIQSMNAGSLTKAKLLKEELDKKFGNAKEFNGIKKQILNRNGVFLDKEGNILTTGGTDPKDPLRLAKNKGESGLTQLEAEKVKKHFNENNEGGKTLEEFRKELKQAILFDKYKNDKNGVFAGLGLKLKKGESLEEMASRTGKRAAYLLEKYKLSGLNEREKKELSAIKIFLKEMGDNVDLKAQQKEFQNSRIKGKEFREAERVKIELDVLKDKRKVDERKIREGRSAQEKLFNEIKDKVNGAKLKDTKITADGDLVFVITRIDAVSGKKIEEKIIRKPQNEEEKKMFERIKQAKKLEKNIDRINVIKSDSERNKNARDGLLNEIEKIEGGKNSRIKLIKDAESLKETGLDERIIKRKKELIANDTEYKRELRHLTEKKVEDNKPEMVAAIKKNLEDMKLLRKQYETGEMSKRAVKEEIKKKINEIKDIVKKEYEKENSNTGGNAGVEVVKAADRFVAIALKREKINMSISKLERARGKMNEDALKNLSPEEREKVLRLHDALKRKQSAEKEVLIIERGNKATDLLVKKIEDRMRTDKYFGAYSSKDIKKYVEAINAAKKDPTDVGKVALANEALSKLVKAIEGEKKYGDLKELKEVKKALVEIKQKIVVVDNKNKALNALIDEINIVRKNNGMDRDIHSRMNHISLMKRAMEARAEGKSEILDSNGKRIKIDDDGEFAKIIKEGNVALQKLLDDDLKKDSNLKNNDKIQELAIEVRADKVVKLDEKFENLKTELNIIEVKPNDVNNEGGNHLDSKIDGNSSEKLTDALEILELQTKNRERKLIIKRGKKAEEELIAQYKNSKNPKIQEYIRNINDTAESAKEQKRIDNLESKIQKQENDLIKKLTTEDEKLDGYIKTYKEQEKAKRDLVELEEKIVATGGSKTIDKVETSEKSQKITLKKTELEGNEKAIKDGEVAFREIKTVIEEKILHDPTLSKNNKEIMDIYNKVKNSNDTFDSATKIKDMKLLIEKLEASTENEFITPEFKEALKQLKKKVEIEDKNIKDKINMASAFADRIKEIKENNPTAVIPPEIANKIEDIAKMQQVLKAIEENKPEVEIDGRKYKITGDNADEGELKKIIQNGEAAIKEMATGKVVDGRKTVDVPEVFKNDDKVKELLFELRKDTGEKIKELEILYTETNKEQNEMAVRKLKREIADREKELIKMKRNLEKNKDIKDIINDVEKLERHRVEVERITKFNEQDEKTKKELLKYAEDNSDSNSALKENVDELKKAQKELEKAKKEREEMKDELAKAKKEREEKLKNVAYTNENRNRIVEINERRIEIEKLQKFKEARKDFRKDLERFLKELEESSFANSKTVKDEIARLRETLESTSRVKTHVINTALSQFSKIDENAIEGDLNKLLETLATNGYKSKYVGSEAVLKSKVENLKKIENTIENAKSSSVLEEKTVGVKTLVERQVFLNDEEIEKRIEKEEKRIESLKKGFDWATRQKMEELAKKREILEKKKEAMDIDSVGILIGQKKELMDEKKSIEARNKSIDTLISVLKENNVNPEITRLVGIIEEGRKDSGNAGKMKLADMALNELLSKIDGDKGLETMIQESLEKNKGKNELEGNEYKELKKQIMETNNIVFKKEITILEDLVAEFERIKQKPDVIVPTELSEKMESITIMQMVLKAKERGEIEINVNGKVIDISNDDEFIKIINNGKNAIKGLSEAIEKSPDLFKNNLFMKELAFALREDVEQKITEVEAKIKDATQTTSTTFDSAIYRDGLVEINKLREEILELEKNSEIMYLEVDKKIAEKQIKLQEKEDEIEKFLNNVREKWQTLVVTVENAIKNGTGDKDTEFLERIDEMLGDKYVKEQQLFEERAKLKDLIKEEEEKLRKKIEAIEKEEEEKRGKLVEMYELNELRKKKLEVEKKQAILARGEGALEKMTEELKKDSVDGVTKVEIAEMEKTKEEVGQLGVKLEMDKKVLEKMLYSNKDNANVGKLIELRKKRDELINEGKQLTSEKLVELRLKKEKLIIKIGKNGRNEKSAEKMQKEIKEIDANISKEIKKIKDKHTKKLNSNYSTMQNLLKEMKNSKNIKEQELAMRTKQVETDMGKINELNKEIKVLNGKINTAESKIERTLENGEIVDALEALKGSREAEIQKAKLKERKVKVQKGKEELANLVKTLEKEEYKSQNPVLQVYLPQIGKDSNKEKLKRKEAELRKKVNELNKNNEVEETKDKPNKIKKFKEIAIKMESKKNKNRKDALKKLDEKTITRSGEKSKSKRLEERIAKLETKSQEVIDVIRGDFIREIREIGDKKIQKQIEDYIKVIESADTSNEEILKCAKEILKITKKVDGEAKNVKDKIEEMSILQKEVEDKTKRLKEVTINDGEKNLKRASNAATESAENLAEKTKAKVIKGSEEYDSAVKNLTDEIKVKAEPLVNEAKNVADELMTKLDAKTSDTIRFGKDATIELLDDLKDRMKSADFKEKHPELEKLVNDLESALNDNKSTPEQKREAVDKLLKGIEDDKSESFKEIVADKVEKIKAAQKLIKVVNKMNETKKALKNLENNPNDLKKSVELVKKIQELMVEVNNIDGLKNEDDIKATLSEDNVKKIQNAEKVVEVLDLVEDIKDAKNLTKVDALLKILNDDTNEVIKSISDGNAIIDDSRNKIAETKEMAEINKLQEELKDITSKEPKDSKKIIEKAEELIEKIKKIEDLNNDVGLQSEIATCEANMANLKNVEKEVKENAILIRDIESSIKITSNSMLNEEIEIKQNSIETFENSIAKEEHRMKQLLADLRCKDVGGVLGVADDIELLMNLNKRNEELAMLERLVEKEDKLINNFLNDIDNVIDNGRLQASESVSLKDAREKIQEYLRLKNTKDRDEEDEKKYQESLIALNYAIETIGLREGLVTDIENFHELKILQLENNRVSSNNKGRLGSEEIKAMKEVNKGEIDELEMKVKNEIQEIEDDKGANINIPEITILIERMERIKKLQEDKQTCYDEKQHIVKEQEEGVKNMKEVVAEEKKMVNAIEKYADGENGFVITKEDFEQMKLDGFAVDIIEGKMEDGKIIISKEDFELLKEEVVKQESAIKDAEDILNLQKEIGALKNEIIQSEGATDILINELKSSDDPKILAQLEAVIEGRFVAQDVSKMEDDYSGAKVLAGHDLQGLMDDSEGGLNGLQRLQKSQENRDQVVKMTDEIREEKEIITEAINELAKKENKTDEDKELIREIRESHLKGDIESVIQLMEQNENFEKKVEKLKTIQEEKNEFIAGHDDVLDVDGKIDETKLKTKLEDTNGEVAKKILEVEDELKSLPQEENVAKALCILDEVKIEENILKQKAEEKEIDQRIEGANEAFKVVVGRDMVSLSEEKPEFEPLMNAVLEAQELKKDNDAGLSLTVSEEKRLAELEEKFKKFEKYETDTSVLEAWNLAQQLEKDRQNSNVVNEMELGEPKLVVEAGEKSLREIKREIENSVAFAGTSLEDIVYTGTGLKDIVMKASGDIAMKVKGVELYKGYQFDMPDGEKPVDAIQAAKEAREQQKKVREKMEKKMKQLEEAKALRMEKEKKK
jgi:hypothetical protein